MRGTVVGLHVLLCTVRMALTNQCSMQPPVKLTLNSRRNETGYWLAQVNLEHGENNQKDTHPYTVDIEHNVLNCESGGNMIHIQANIAAPPPRPGPGYEFYPGFGYYKFHDKSEIFSDARRICQQEGAHLAIINSEEESKILKDIFSRFPTIQDVKYNDFAFIGFHDLYHEGHYLTIFDQPLSTTGFTRFWDRGQPDDAGGDEDCGSVHRNGGLNDLVCSKKHAFICEQEL